MSEDAPAAPQSHKATHGDRSTFAIEADVTAHPRFRAYLGSIYLWIGGARYGVYERDTDQWLNPTVGNLASARARIPLEIEKSVMRTERLSALSRICAAEYGDDESDSHLAKDHEFLTDCIFCAGTAFDDCFIAFPSDGKVVRILACALSRSDPQVPVDVREAFLDLHLFHAILDSLLDSLPTLEGFVDNRRH